MLRVFFVLFGTWGLLYLSQLVFLGVAVNTRPHTHTPSHFPPTHTLTLPAHTHSITVVTVEAYSATLAPTTAYSFPRVLNPFECVTLVRTRSYKEPQLEDTATTTNIGRLYASLICVNIKKLILSVLFMF